MLLFVFAGAKSSREISKFLFLISANEGIATFSLQEVQESAGDSTVVLFLVYFAVLSLVFELKQTLVTKPYP